MSNYRIGGTRNYHLCRGASCTPNPSSLPDYGFEFKTRDSLLTQVFLAELVIYKEKI